MKAYILSVMGAVFLLDLTAIIIPQGKTGKMIGGIIRICGALIMLLPIVGVVNNIRYAFSDGGNSSADTNYLNKSLSMRIESYIEETYGEECTVKKRDCYLTVYADKSIFPSSFERDIKDSFGEEFIIIYEY